MLRSWQNLGYSFYQVVTHSVCLLSTSSVSKTVLGSLSRDEEDEFKDDFKDEEITSAVPKESGG